MSILDLLLGNGSVPTTVPTTKTRNIVLETVIDATITKTKSKSTKKKAHKDDDYDEHLEYLAEEMEEWYNRNRPFGVPPFSKQRKRTNAQRKGKFIFAMGDSIVDNVFRDMITEPAVGSVVYCDLAFNSVEHSGIYIGKNKIVHLNGDGLVEAVSAREFLARLNGKNTAITIYAPCIGTTPLGNKKVADRAKERIGEELDYDLFNNNCHKFSWSCLTGKTPSRDIMFGELIHKVQKKLDVDNWRAWDYPGRY